VIANILLHRIVLLVFVVLALRLEVAIQQKRDPLRFFSAELAVYGGSVYNQPSKAHLYPAWLGVRTLDVWQELS
jgi:hypothetical protein